MNKRAAIIITALLMGAILPGIVASVAVPDEPTPTEYQETTVPTSNIPETTWYEPTEQTLPILTENGVMELNITEYITGVVLMEMPASFETEALKAQSVVARTYALKQYVLGRKHPGCAVCTDSNCCQGYISVQEYLAKGGTKTDVDKIVQAAEATGDLVLTYNNELIDATYFSCSGGKTEDAAAVWGADIPYLQSVESPGEQMAQHYIDTVTFTAEQFRERIKINLIGQAETWFGKVTYTEGGGVDTLEICGDIYRGVELRRLLGLKSTAFQITAVGDTVTITTKGFGHRVGMSQYGADAMAVSGANYGDILSHYYPGTVLESFTDD